MAARSERWVRAISLSTITLRAVSWTKYTTQKKLVVARAMAIATERRGTSFSPTT